MRLRYSCFALVLILGGLQTAMAVEVAYQFTGMVFPPVPNLFGVTVPDFSSVHGQFVFDTDAQATHNFGGCGNCNGFLQQRFNGFSASFDGMVIRADKYVVAVFNDEPGFGETFDDLFVVRFGSDLDPSLNSPLIVNGTPYNVGSFDLVFRADPDQYELPQLPSEVEYSDFTSLFGTLSDLQPGNTLLYSVDTLTGVTIQAVDYDLNGSVGQSDFEVWRSRFGSLSDRSADGNHDGLIDSADYVVWRKQMSAGNNVGAFNSVGDVPEPATLLLLLPVAVSCLVRGSGCRLVEVM